MACNYFAKKGWLTGPRGAATGVNLQDSEQCSVWRTSSLCLTHSNISSYSFAYFLLIVFKKLSLIFVKEVKDFDVHRINENFDEYKIIKIQ